MTSKIVKYHHRTNEVALLESDGEYWIGTYAPFMTHQNGEPLFCFYASCENYLDGLQQLSALTGDEF